MMPCHHLALGSRLGLNGWLLSIRYESMSSPTLVSFYTGDAHYAAAAEALRADCSALGLDHDIRELKLTPGETWLDACRRKVPFYLEMHRKHRRPILWLDVDSRLTRLPRALENGGCDLAGFLRGTRYLRDFDPVAMPRFFAPFALYFNFTPQTTAFLELMAELEQQSPANVSDDYLLQEAWLRHRRPLAVLVLPPDLVGREWPLRGDQAIYVGISGSVSAFKDVAKQHTAGRLAPARRKATLVAEGDAALKAGQEDDAIVLYRYALAAVPDDALAAKVARLIKRRSRVEGR